MSTPTLAILRVPSYLRNAYVRNTGKNVDPQEYRRLSSLVAEDRLIDNADTPTWVEFHVRKGLITKAKAALDAKAKSDAEAENLMTDYVGCCEIAAKFDLVPASAEGLFLQEALVA